VGQKQHNILQVRELNRADWVLYIVSIRLPAAVLMCSLAPSLTHVANSTPAAAYGLTERIATKPYLRMPPNAKGQLPALLSQTGAFLDTPHLKMAPGLVPYDLVVPFWSDGAQKTRAVALPAGKVAFRPTGEWKFPAGTVFVKTFELPTDAMSATAKRRLETRILVLDDAGGVYGADYKWRADGSDADLLPGALTEQIPIKAASGAVHMQTWYYPSRQDCLTCHNARAGNVLGLKTRQLNKPFPYPSGVTDNELRAWNHIGLFEPALKEADLPTLAKLAAADDTSRTIEDRARSYLDANCSHCHQPGGTVANFDARYDTPLAQQNLIDGAVLIGQGIDHPRIIAPHDKWRSILYMRVDTDGDIRMPPLARETVDQNGVRLLREWIDSLPGREVLAPPSIEPPGGTFSVPVLVSLGSQTADADIRYTLDGSAPGLSDPRYDKPLKLEESAVLRTRAFKEGYTRSIAAQQVYIVNPR
jgi:uncharacterized repeat protein (TIGR03806 family)